ncbi:hypothetical protein ERJ75_001092700 [Trypanosoma vivax]|nr:hypothetical protein ERJ75_001092700 [Trypanosoma vivax]
MSSASRKRKAVGKQPSKECGADEWDREEGRRRQRNGEGVPHAESSGPPQAKQTGVPGGVFATMQDAERAGAESEVSHRIELQPGSETNMQTWLRHSLGGARRALWRSCGHGEVPQGERRRGEQGKQTTTLNAWAETLGGNGPGEDKNGAWCLHGFA